MVGIASQNENSAADRRSAPSSIAATMVATARVGIGEHAGRELPDAREIDREQRQNGAELDKHREGLAELRIVESKKTLDQQEVPGRGDRQEFGQSFDDTEDERLEKVEKHA